LQGGKWRELRLVLTASRLIFSNKGSEEIKDCIPLVEVERVKLQNAGPPPSH